MRDSVGVELELWAWVYERAIETVTIPTFAAVFKLIKL